MMTIKNDICKCKKPAATCEVYFGKEFIYCTKCNGVFTFAMLDRLYQQNRIKNKPFQLANYSADSVGAGYTAPKKKGAKGKMVNVQEQTESDFVDGTFAKAHPNFEFSDSGELQDDAFNKGKQRLVIGVKADGKPKKWSPNKTSMRFLVKKYGADTKKWVGKKEAWDVKDTVVSGEDTEVIYVRGSTKRKGAA